MRPRSNPFGPGAIARVIDDSAGNVRAKIVTIYALLLAATAAAWTLAFVAFASHPLLLGTALLAYTFGLRHAVDADHIAAIDNVTRKLMQQGQRPVGVGFFFSLGHSAVVVLMSIGVAFAASALTSRFDSMKEIGGVVST